MNNIEHVQRIPRESKVGALPPVFAVHFKGELKPYPQTVRVRQEEGVTEIQFEVGRKLNYPYRLVLSSPSAGVTLNGQPIPEDLDVTALIQEGYNTLQIEGDVESVAVVISFNPFTLRP